MDPTALTRDLPALQMRAAFRPDSVNNETRTAEVVFSTGARVKRGFWEPYWEELSLDPKAVRMERLNNGAPLLDSHDSYSGVSSVLGVVESARIEDGKGIATVRFAKAEDDPEADKAFRKVKDGILQNISVGYRVHKLEQIEDGRSRDDKTPVLLATDWEPYELSVVPMGADDGAGFRSAHRDTNPCVISTRTKEKDMSETTKEAVAAAAKTPEARISAVEEATRAAAEQRAREAGELAAQVAREREEAIQAERVRVGEIRKLVRRAKLGDALADKLIGDGATVDQVRAAVLEHLADEGEKNPTTSHVRFAAGDDASDKFVRGASAWLFERAGLVGMIEQAASKDPRKFKDVALDPGEFRGMSLVELARESLERRGVKTRGMSRMDMIGLAFTFRGGYQVASDFSVLFENVMNKTLLGSYAITPDTWSRFCGTITVPDFRPANRFRTGSLTTLDSVSELGEFKNKIVPDGQKTAVSVATKGNIIALSRQTIVNDDMGALTDVAAKLGRAARLSIESDVYTLLALNSGLGPTMSDSAAFFHANRSNVNSTGSALSVAGIDADRVVMAQQKDLNSNEYLDLRPAVLLVPIGLGGTAREINESQYDTDAVTTNATNKFMKPNKVRGLFRDVVDTPRLSGTRRYLFADPSIAPAIVVAFLEGQGQAPVLDSQDGWRVDGVEWKVRLDYKAQVFDPKGAVTNAGA